MARFVFGMNQSVDGFVDHTAFDPDPVLFRHFVGKAQQLTGSVYGRTMYEVMRYWDTDDPGWGADEQTYAEAWRRQPKWVVSRTLTEVGPNATIVADDLEHTLRAIKADHEGDIEVAGTVLAHSLVKLGLIDEFQIYLHPVVLGSGKPYFAGPVPRLRLVGEERITDDVVRLSYALA